MNAELDKVNSIALGIGVNVNFDSHDFPPDLRTTATSLKIAAGRSWLRSEVAAGLLTELDRAYGQLNEDKFETLANEWESACSTLGRSVCIRIGTRTVTGRAETLDTDGALLVRTQHGHLERVLGGDLTQRVAGS